MRNLLEEFLITHGKSKPTILGVREHIFTGRLIFLFATNIFKSLQFFLLYFINFLCGLMLMFIT
jgi:hypothetical protein